MEDPLDLDNMKISPMTDEEVILTLPLEVMEENEATEPMISIGKKSNPKVMEKMEKARIGKEKKAKEKMMEDAVLRKENEMLRESQKMFQGMINQLVEKKTALENVAVIPDPVAPKEKFRNDPDPFSKWTFANCNSRWS